MKDIKFKVLDKSKKKFVKDEVFIDGEGDGYFLGDLPNWDTDNISGVKERNGFTRKRFEIVMATSFKDKNGNDIYFGDKLRCWIKDNVEPEGGYWWYGIVEWFKGCTVVKEVGFDYSDSIFPEDYTFLFMDTEEYEIVK